MSGSSGWVAWTAGRRGHPVYRFPPFSYFQGGKYAILLDKQLAAGEEEGKAYHGQSGSPGLMSLLRGSITTVLNSFFIRDGPLADGTPPETWSWGWRIGFSKRVRDL